MKILKFLISILIFVIFFSCGNKNYSCNSKISKNTLKGIWKDDVKKNEFTNQIYGLNVDDAISFIDEYMEIEQVRTLSKDETIKKCECAAKVVFNIPSEVKESISKINNDGGLFGQAILENFSAEEGIDIKYNIQETEDGDIYAETYLIDNLSLKIVFYKNLISKYKNSNRKGEVILWTPIEGVSGGDYTMKFIENNKVEMRYKYFDFEHTDFVDYYPESNRLISKGGWEQFKFKDEFLIVEDKEGDYTYKRK